MVFKCDSKDGSAVSPRRLFGGMVEAAAGSPLSGGRSETQHDTVTFKCLVPSHEFRASGISQGPDYTWFSSLGVSVSYVLNPLTSAPGHLEAVLHNVHPVLSQGPFLGFWRSIALCSAIIMASSTDPLHTITTKRQMRMRIMFIVWMDTGACHFLCWTGLR